MFLEGLKDFLDFDLSTVIAWRGLELQKKAVFWSTVSSIVSLFSLFGVVVALWLNRRAVLVTEKANRDQTRAYLDAVKCEVCYGGRLRKPAVTGDDEAYYLRLSIQNFGASPATEFWVQSEVFILKYTENGNEELYRSFESSPSVWLSLMPGAPRTLKVGDGYEVANAIHWASQNDIHNELRCLLVLRGSIHFKTIFNEERSTPFAFTADGIMLKRHLEDRADWRKSGKRNGMIAPSPLELQFSTKKLALNKND